MNFFNVDGKFAHFMTRLFDLAVLNFLFLFTSIPLLTIGSSYSALYEVTLKMFKNCDPIFVKAISNTGKPILIVLPYCGYYLSFSVLLLSWIVF